MSASAACGFAGGLSVGYILAKKLQKKKEDKEFQQLVIPWTREDSDETEGPQPTVFQEKLPERLTDEDELAALNEEIDEMMANGDEPTYEQLVAAGRNIVIPDLVKFKDLDPRFAETEESDDEPVEEVQEEPEEPVVENIFTSSRDPWDYEEERAKRSEDAPYILHTDEYFRDEGGNQQHTLTWYEGDDVLVDEEDKPVYNHHDVVGELKFGHGSNDPNVVYIRNEKLHTEYEILRHSGHFAEEILGLHAEVELQNELRHSDRNQRFRSSD
jgi:hypothetical protein